jgi:3',5'-cyclic AMP phosphodiesterase CpdA
MSDGMFTLAHISDVHLGPLPNVTVRELMSKRITGYVNWQRSRRKHLFGNTLEQLVENVLAAKADHLAITGDLINLSADAEIAAATAWLQTLPDPLTVSLVPGNHDAYVPGALNKVIHAWRPWMAGDVHREEWRRHDDIFPYLRVRGDVALIGVSTATASPPFMASGYFGRNQARKLADLLRETGKSGLCRVIMIHHPPIPGATPNYKRMIGIRRFAAALSLGGAELVIHGHTHLNSLYRLSGRDGPVPVIGIASASHGHAGTKPPSAYNLFRIEKTNKGWQIGRERHSLNADSTGFELNVSDIVGTGSQ